MFFDAGWVLARLCRLGRDPISVTFQFEVASVRFEEFLILLAFTAIPLLVCGFCWWRAIQIQQARTSRNSRLLARKVATLIVVNSGVAIACALLGLSLCVLAAATKSPDEAVFVFGAYALFGGVPGLSVIPLVRIRRSLQTVSDEDDDSLSEEEGLAAIEQPGFSLGTIFFVLATIVVVLSLLLGFGFVLFSALFFGLIPLLFWQRRRAREGQFLWLLALSVRSGHDLAQEIQDHAATWTGSFAVRLRQLAVYLKAGRPLGMALERVPGLLPRWVVAAVRIGDETGTLSEVLNECATTQLNWMKERFRTGSIGSLLIYLACYPWVILAPVSFMTYYIVPKFKAIFDGFGTELPGVTEAFIQSCDTWLVGMWLVSPFLFLVTLILLRFDHSGWRNLRSGLFRGFYPRYDASPIMRHLARMIEKGKTLPDSLLAIANSYHRPTVATSVAEVYVETESGGDCWKSLLKRGFLSRRDLALIEAAQRSGNLPWALREIADVREKRYLFRVDTLVQLFRPVPIIAVGLLVAWVCIAMFLPVIKLVNDLT